MNFGPDVLCISFHPRANMRLWGFGSLLVCCSQSAWRRKLTGDRLKPEKRQNWESIEDRQKPASATDFLGRKRIGLFLPHRQDWATAKAWGCPVSLNAGQLLTHSVNSEHFPQRGEWITELQTLQGHLRTLWIHMGTGNRAREGEHIAWIW